MTGLAANSKSGPNVKLEDNAEQLPSAYIDKEKLPEKPGAGAVVVALAGAAAVVPGAGAVVVALAGAAAVVTGAGAVVVALAGAAAVLTGAGAVVVALAGAAAAAGDVEPTADAAAVGAAAPPVVDDAFDAAAAGGLGLEEQTALKERPEPSGSGWHWPLGNSLGSGEPWLH